MTKPKLLLHPGSSQGGSTWIQNLCTRNADRLKAQDFHYLHDFRALPFNALAEDAPAPFHEALDAFLARDMPDGDAATVFLSNENALGDPLQDRLFGHAPRMAENLLPLFDRFGPAQVVYVWRPLDRFLLSVFNQRKKQGAKMTFESFSRQAEARAYDSGAVVEALRILSRKAEIRVMDFEFLSKRPRRFAAEFFALGGVELGEGFDFVQGGRNPSIRPEGIRILEHAKDFLDKGEYLELRKFVQAKFPKTDFTPEERAFLDAWAERSRENDARMKGALKEFARVIEPPRAEA